MTIPEELYRLAMRNAYAVGGYDAGAQMYAFYPTSVRVFPKLNPQIEILPDTQAGTFGLAWYLGRNPLGQPKFAVRDDLVLNSKIAWHEGGHALEEELIARGLTEDYIRTKYWKWRGFDVQGTWQEWYAYAVSKSASGGWAYLPGESIAESLSAATGGYVESEWTANFGLALAVNNGVYDPSGGGMRARVFWLELCAEVDMDANEVRTIAVAAANEATERLQATDDAIKGVLNFHNHDVKLYSSNGSPLDIAAKSGGPNVHTERPEA